jgi:nitroreductase
VYTQPITEIVRQRFSCRTYENRPIEPEKRHLLNRFIAETPAGPLGTSARFELVAATGQDLEALKGLGTYGFIRGATGFIVGAMRGKEDLLEDFGFLLERIVLHATDLGLGTCWLGGSFTKSSFAERIGVVGDEIVPAVVSVGHIANNRRSVDRLMRLVANSDNRLPWERLFFQGGLDAPLSREEAGVYAVPLDMVRLAPSASNKQPWRIVRDSSTWHFCLRRTPGYRKRRASRWWVTVDLQRVDLGIAMSHFELTARELGLPGAWQVAEPSIVKSDERIEYVASWVGQ